VGLQMEEMFLESWYGGSAVVVVVALAGYLRHVPNRKRHLRQGMDQMRNICAANTNIMCIIWNPHQAL